MNQQQYIRLSIVLAIPTLAFSLFLGQEDVFQERGQFVQCSVSEANCSPMINTSRYDFSLYLRYFVYPSDRFLGLYNIDFPIKVYFKVVDSEMLDANSLVVDGMLDVSSIINSKNLETSDCFIWEQKDINCSNISDIIPNITTEGRIEFINPEDEIAFNTVVAEGESYFEDYTLNRIVEGFGLFLLFATPYLIFSWLVHFIIYGAKIGSKKKRPYQ